MLVNLIVLLVVVAATVGLGLLARRAWRSKRGIVKWGGLMLAGVPMLVLALVSVVGVIGMVKTYAPRGGSQPDIQVEGTAGQIARGEHLATILCASCHGANGELPLAGGSRDLGAEIPIPIGSFIPFNLTPGGPLKDWSDGEIFGALRQGVDRDGHPLLFMNTSHFRFMSDDDLKAVIAYLRSQPAVENATGGDNATLLAVILNGVGAFPEQAAVTGPVVAPPRAATAAYGKYILNFDGCKDCHGPTLSADGGSFAPPGAPNLTFIVPKWSKDDFFTAMRTGVDSTGHRISDAMPWKNVGKYDDIELAALYEYLHGLAPGQK